MDNLAPTLPTKPPFGNGSKPSVEEEVHPNVSVTISAADADDADDFDADDFASSVAPKFPSMLLFPASLSPLLVMFIPSSFVLVVDTKAAPKINAVVPIITDLVLHSPGLFEEPPPPDFLFFFFEESMSVSSSSLIKTENSSFFELLLLLLLRIFFSAAFKRGARSSNTDMMRR
jgi:hypothetical protein